MERFKITEVQYTSLYMSTLFPTLIFGIPSTWAVNRFGIKKCQCTGMAIALIGLILRLVFREYEGFYIATLTIGFSNILISTMGTATLSGLFSKEKIGIAVGSIIASGAIGKALAEITASLFESFEIMTVVDVFLQLAILLAWAFLMRDIESTDIGGTVYETFKDVLQNKYIWISSMGVMLVFGLYTGISAHLPTIIGTKGYNAVISGGIASAISFGYFIGAVTLPKVMSVLKNKKMFMVVLAFISAISTIGAANSTVAWALAFYVFCIGICVGGLLPMSLSIPVAILRFNMDKSRVAGALLSTFQLAGAIVLPAYVIVPLVGNDINNFLVYAAALMGVEGLLYMALPKNK